MASWIENINLIDMNMKGESGLNDNCTSVYHSGLKQLQNKVIDCDYLRKGGQLWLRLHSFWM